MLTYIALALGVIGIVLAWNANRKNKDLKERIAQINSRVYNLRREIQEAQEAAVQERHALRFEILKLQGNLTITSEMQIGQILAVHPQAQQVLAGFHLGGCSSCMVDDTQSLAQAAAVNGREIEPILVALNTLVAEGAHSNGMVSPEQLNAPNVELQV
jgi:hybrid cluster-associated redox disulfide protein